MSQLFFTVFTPVYNRKHTIYRVWDSLINQTQKNFEWLVINDGSKDGVESLLEKYRKEADFNVRIYHQKNSGKHMAHNKALELAKGDLFIVADSDDSFNYDAIEVFEKYWKHYGDDSLSGITVLCKDENGKILGDPFPKEGVLDQVEVFYKYYRHKKRGEHWGCLRLDVLKKYPFPNIAEAKFFPESYAWEQIALKYKAVFLNIALRTYYQDSGNQLTKNKKEPLGQIRIKNFNTIWWINMIFPYVEKYMNVIDIIKKFAYMWKSTFLIKESFSYTYQKMKGKRNKILALLTFIPTFIYCKIKL